MDRAAIPFLPVFELSELIKNREVSPVEVVESYLDRIDSLNDRLYAYLTVCPDQALQEYSGGLGMANGAEACERALNLLGVKRIGVLTPYWASTSNHVIRFFNEAGFEVIAHKDLECPSPVAIAHVEAGPIRAALREIDSDQVEAIVQCGTDLNMVELADEADRWLGKPVLAINAVIWWMALRDNDIQDKLYGYGRMLSEF